MDLGLQEAPTLAVLIPGAVKFSGGWPPARSNRLGLDMQCHGHLSSRPYGVSGSQA